LSTSQTVCHVGAHLKQTVQSATLNHVCQFAIGEINRCRLNDTAPRGKYTELSMTS
jgi:hypothetical protein